MFDMAFTQTTNLVKNRLDSYTPEATGMWNNFKKYFQVSNQFVVGKLRCLLFPFGSRSWKRVCQVNDDGTETFFPPRQDLNAPDLYIPLRVLGRRSAGAYGSEAGPLHHQLSRADL